jgi:hypothetical protein
MAIRIARQKLGQVFSQRCFYLFAVLLVLVAGVPFVPPTQIGRLAVGGINAFLVVATVAAVGRTVLSFVIALLLAAPALLFQYLGVTTGQPDPLAISWLCGALLYGAAVTYLLRYVFRPEVMTSDKLYGAAASYLMLGVVWAYIYPLIDYLYPRSFSVGGQAGALSPFDALYFSFTVLTSTGFGDIVPLGKQARAVCVVEQITGALFVAILIARLAGVYLPIPRDRRS